jgi:hypothetical protein
MLKNTRSPHIVVVKKGEEVTLTAPFEGTWSNKATGSSITLKASSSRVYTVKDASGCVQERFEVQVTR